MNPEAQRIAIAEACGWRIIAMTEAAQQGLYKPGDVTDPSRWQLLFDPKNRCQAGTEHREPKWGSWISCLPDYLTDLNAIHEAEKILTDPQYDDFILMLHHSWSGNFIKHTPRAMRQIIMATAAQRAEAFLRTIGKWTEDKP